MSDVFMLPFTSGMLNADDNNLFAASIKPRNRQGTDTFASPACAQPQLFVVDRLSETELQALEDCGTNVPCSGRTSRMNMSAMSARSCVARKVKRSFID